jgi:hypothetical protein
MSAYVRAQSAAEIFRNAARLYRTHFWALFLAYLLPMSPLLVAYAIAVATKSLTLTCVASLILLVATSIATLPMTAVVSDICLGNQPDLARAFRLLLNGGIVGTYLLSLVLILLGCLLVVPGVILGIWWVFVIPVMVLEGRRGWQALERSRSLGRGHYWRILGILLLVTAVTWTAGALIGLAVGLVPEIPGLWLAAQIVGELLTSLPGPIVAIVSVLLYYDLRARKEAYDSAALAEDLRT